MLFKLRFDTRYYDAIIDQIRRTSPPLQTCSLYTDPRLCHRTAQLLCWLLWNRLSYMNMQRWTDLVLQPILLPNGPTFGFVYLVYNETVAHSFAFVSSGMYVKVLQADYNNYSLCDWLGTEEGFLRELCNKPYLEHLYTKVDLKWDDIPGMWRYANGYKQYGGGRWVDKETFERHAAEGFDEIACQRGPLSHGFSVMFSKEPTKHTTRITEWILKHEVFTVLDSFPDASERV